MAFFERQGKLVEAQRLRMRTTYDVEMMRQVGSCAGIENYSMHIDGLQLYQAHYSGIREKKLREPAYHIEHGGGFKPGSRALDHRLARQAIPQITNEQLMEWIYEMYVTKQPVAFNRPDWGLAEEPLPETAPPARRLTVRTQTEVA